MVESLRITLTDMAYGGDAVGKHQGRIVFVPLGLPGEVVTVTLVETHASYARGRLLDVEFPSRQRVAAPCPAFGRCGGCQWQHMRYAEQLRLKRYILRNALERIGGEASPAVQPMLGMQDPWQYRNHVHLRIDDRGQPGYYALHSHEIIATDHCPIAHPLLETMWDAHQQCHLAAEELILRAGLYTGERMAIVRGRQGIARAEMPKVGFNCLYLGPSGRPKTVWGRDYIAEQVGNHRLRISAESFFQNNTVQAERLVESVASLLHLQPGESLLDAYCGVGLFGIGVTDASNPLYGIESSVAAVRDARVNADHGTFLRGDVNRVLREHKLRVDAIVLDPPRGGCSPETIGALADCGASRIVYVSCDPATLARDVARFREYGYALIQAQPIDLFPQTYHIETVALLNRVDQATGNAARPE